MSEQRDPILSLLDRLGPENAGWIVGELAGRRTNEMDEMGKWLWDQVIAAVRELGKTMPDQALTYFFAGVNKAPGQKIAIRDVVDALIEGKQYQREWEKSQK